MANSEISISNVAIGKLGGNSIISFDDPTVEAELCKTNFPFARDLILAAVDWTFARKRARLVPLTGESGEIIGTDFSYRFQLPTDCLTLREVSADGSFDDKHSFLWEKEERTLVAEKSVLYIKYTRRVEDPLVFSPGMVHILATQLAGDICVTLTGSKTREKSLYDRVTALIDNTSGHDGVQSLPQRQVAQRITNARFRYGGYSTTTN